MQPSMKGAGSTTLLHMLKTLLVSSLHRDCAAVWTRAGQGGVGGGTPHVDDVLVYNQLLPNSFTEVVTEPSGNMKSSLASLL